MTHLTAESIRQIQESWERAGAEPERAATLFYDRLFAIAPHLQPLFPEDLSEQKQKLMTTISVAIGALNRPDQLAPIVENLGARHVEYGVRSADYEPVGEALLWTLKEALGEEADGDLLAGWRSVYAWLASLMQQGADRATSSLSSTSGFIPKAPAAAVSPTEPAR